MGKHGIIDNRHRRCRCGRIKPANRSMCFTCKPKNSRRPAVDLDAPYTLADHVALARACGLSYGNLMAIMEHGGQPPLIRSVEWPEGSARGQRTEPDY